jgi:hypothetical protein
MKNELMRSPMRMVVGFIQLFLVQHKHILPTKPFKTGMN